MSTFDHLLLLGRPASGKSEFIDMIKKMDAREREERFFIGDLDEVDDFVWIAEKFVEDDLWEAAGFDRIYSNKEGNNAGLKPEMGKFFDVAMLKFNDAVGKMTDMPSYYDAHTLFIEFSRGGDFGYAHSFPFLKKEIWERTAILYVDVSFDESWRRNNARYQEKLMHSILAHKASDEVMNAFYKTNDWHELSKEKSSGYLPIQGFNIPFVSVCNEPEIVDPIKLSERYAPAMATLKTLYDKR